MNQYPNGPQQPPRELIRVGCKQGKLIITDQHIRVELFSLSSQTMPRSSLTGIDYKLVVPALFGFGGGANLIFHGQGAERLHAELMRPKYAKQIMRMLGY